MAQANTREIGIIMNGVSGRMGYRQHLVRSILAIREEGGIEIGRPVVDPVLRRELGECVLVAADEQRLDGDARAVGELDAALFADREDRPHQVLPVSHAPGDAVHDDPDLAGVRLCHGVPFLSREAVAPSSRAISESAFRDHDTRYGCRATGPMFKSVHVFTVVRLELRA